MNELLLQKSAVGVLDSSVDEIDKNWCSYSCSWNGLIERKRDGYGWERSIVLPTLYPNKSLTVALHLLSVLGLRGGQRQDRERGPGGH